MLITGRKFEGIAIWWIFEEFYGYCYFFSGHEEGILSCTKLPVLDVAVVFCCSMVLSLCSGVFINRLCYYIVLAYTGLVLAYFMVSTRLSAAAHPLWSPHAYGDVETTSTYILSVVPFIDVSIRLEKLWMWACMCRHPLIIFCFGCFRRDHLKSRYYHMKKTTNILVTKEDFTFYCLWQPYSQCLCGGWPSVFSDLVFNVIMSLVDINRARYWRHIVFILIRRYITLLL